MPTDFKRNAIIVFGLAALFYWSFMLVKHDAALRDIIPFGDDPYDAVGSFAVIAGIPIAILSLVRAFRPYRIVPSAAQRMYLVRSQQAVVLAVFFTLATDAVALARHSAMWMSAPARGKLFVFLSSLMIITTIVQLILRTAQKKLGLTETVRWGMPVSIALLAILVLVAYPEQLIKGTATHLLTVVAGDILLFAPMRFLLHALVPNPIDDVPASQLTAPDGFRSAGKRWAIALLAGIVIGAVAFIGEISEPGGAPPSGRAVVVASAFVALGLAGSLLAYAFLREPLGLDPRD